jgi:hypothetical protein
MRLLQAKRRDEASQAGHIVAYPKLFRRVGGQAASGHVPGDQGELVRQSFELLSKLAAVCRAAMRQNKSWTLACATLRNLEALDIDGVDGMLRRA